MNEDSSGALMPIVGLVGLGVELPPSSSPNASSRRPSVTSISVIRLLSKLGGISMLEGSVLFSRLRSVISANIVSQITEWCQVEDENLAYLATLLYLLCRSVLENAFYPGGWNKEAYHFHHRHVLLAS